MTQPSLIIFDLDGTLLDTVRDLGDAVNHALEIKGFPLHSCEEYRQMIGHGITNLVNTALPPVHRDDEYLTLECVEMFKAYYASHIADHTEPYPGIPELLEELQRKGYVLAIASNKFQEGTERLLGIFFPDIRFASVYGNSKGVKLKPDPEVIRHICAETAMELSSATMVGDAGSDVLTAANAGIRSVAVSWGFRPESDLTEADVIAHDIEELRQALLK